MRVLLVNPPPHQRVDQYDTPDFARLGLLYLAARARRERGVEVGFVDAKLLRLDDAAVLGRVRAFRPDLVGLTAFTNEIKPAARIARAVKALSPSIFTIVGGPHVSALPEATLREFPAFDAGALGEGEETFAALLGALAAGRAASSVAGLVVREGEEVRTTARRDPPELDALPPPAWDLAPPQRRYLYMTQRGCPYACTFCQNPNGRRVRQHGVERVVAELDEIARRRPDEVILCDEIFTVDRERTHRLLDAMIAAGLGRRLRFWAQTHVNTVDRELFRKLRAAGCYRCALGIETGDDEQMRAMRKGASRRRVIEARRAAAEAGLPVEGLFIIGHPGETWASARRTIGFAVELNPDTPIFSTMVPYPGTRVGELARRGEQGYRLLSTDWNDYTNQIGDSLALDGLTRRQIEALQMMGYLEVFLANRRFGDLARFAWRYRSEGLAVVEKLLLGRKPRPAAREHEGPAEVAWRA